MKKITSLLSKAQYKISKSIDDDVKTAYALMRMASVFGRKIKLADYSPAVVQRAVEDHFRSEGLEEFPDVDWHQVFFGIVQGMAIKNKWEEWYEEDLASAIFGDILVGENIDTSYEWSQGNLAEVVRKFQEEGKDARDIRNLTMKYVKDKAWDRHNKWQRKGDPFDHRDKTQDGEEEIQGIALDLLNVSPLNREQASTWMSLVKRDSELQSFLKLVNLHVQRSRNDKMLLIWKAMKQFPDFASRTDLARMEITYHDRDAGRTKTKKLYEALGVDEPRKIYYYFDKLQDHLAKLKPKAQEMLAS